MVEAPRLRRALGAVLSRSANQDECVPVARVRVIERVRQRLRVLGWFAPAALGPVARVEPCHVEAEGQQVAVLLRRARFEPALGLVQRFGLGHLGAGGEFPARFFVHAEQILVESRHQQRRGRVVDLPQAGDDAVGSGEQEAPGQADEAVVGLEPAGRGPAAAEHDQLGAFELSAHLYSRSCRRKKPKSSGVSCSGTVSATADS